MQIINTILNMKNLVVTAQQNNKSVALVPTMGSLHSGHGSLIELAKKSCDFVIVSIFVNPLQFNVESDLLNYPRNLEKDALFCQNLGVDIIFAPSVIEMYPNGNINAIISINNLDKNLCGRTRPGHFTGVCSVVGKLFNIVSPNMAFFGKKDIQQFRIIETMVDDLNFSVKVIGGETIRDEDGLALSSRNVHLSRKGREVSVLVPQLLEHILSLIKAGLYDVKDLLEKGLDFLKKSSCSAEFEGISIKLDYLEIVDYKNLQLLEKVSGKFIIATAIFIDNTRLIDNLIYQV